MNLGNYFFAFGYPKLQSLSQVLVCSGDAMLSVSEYAA